MIVFRAAGWQSSHESVYLLLILNLVFSLLVCLVVAYLITRSFLVRSTPGLLLLGCGVVIWGPAGVVATAAARGDANASITIYNSCVWLSGLCHLAGVSLSLRSRRPLSPPVVWLLAGYAHAAGAVILVMLLTLAGWMPTFFVEERGGTPVRQVVLISAIIMFALTALLLGVTNRKPISAFAYWYALALLLIAVGLLGVMLQSYHASILGWTGRATQALGGLYMLLAAAASVRESRVWGISLEAVLQEERDFSAAVLDTAGALVVVLDAQGRITRFNRACERLTGYLAAEVLGRACREFLIPRDEVAGVQNAWQAILAGSIPNHHENHWLARDGTRRLIDWSNTVLVGEAGEVRHVIAIGIDVTDRRRAEETLRENQALMQAVMDGSPDLIYLKDLDGRVLMANPAACEALGRSAQEVVGKTARELHSDRPEVARAIMENDRRIMESGETETIEEVGGKGRAYLSTKTPYRGAGGNVIGLIGISHDITERKRAEETLREWNATLEAKVAQRTTELEHRTRQLQKLAAELSRAEERERKRVAEILHEDLQQQIAGAKLQLGVLSHQAKDDPTQQLTATEIGQILKNAIGMSRSLSHELSPGTFYGNNLGEALEWLARHMEAAHDVTIQVQVGGEGTLPSEALTVFLFRAAREMLANVVRHAGVRAAGLRLRRMNRYVGLCVSDRGRGFDPQELQDTAGFGLRGIRERVELFGGRMKIRSVTGRGTVVRIVVPEACEDADTALKGGNPNYEIRSAKPIRNPNDRSATSCPTAVE